MKRSSLIIISIVLILIWGGVSALQMQRDYLPPINNSTLMVTVQANNYEADQVKSKITLLIERAVREVNGLQYTESNSYNGGLMCSLYFPIDSDMVRAKEELKQALSNLSLPIGVSKPLITAVSTNSFPIMRLDLTDQSNVKDEAVLRTSVQQNVVNQLQSVPGVDKIQVTGGGSSGYIVTTRTSDLDANRVTMEEVKRSLASLNPILPQGKIGNQQIAIPVRIADWNGSLEILKETPVYSSEGKMIRLSAVADVTPSIVDVQTINRTNGQPSVILEVLKTSSSNITDVTDRIHGTLKQIQGGLPDGIQLSVLFDRGADIRVSLADLIKEGILGCVFSMLSVFFFLRNVRATALIALSLPICLLAATALLKMMGISLNILTVSGLIVAMGRVVDDTIVVLDNMYRKVEEAHYKINVRLLSGAVREMIPAIVSSTATTITVFLPIVFVGGIVHSAFSAFAWTVVIALTVSLFVALLAVPALAQMGWKPPAKKPRPLFEPILLSALHGSFLKKKWVISLTIIIFLITIAEGLRLPVNILPANGPGQISIKLELPEDSSLSMVDASVRSVEALLKSDTRIKTFSASLGSSFIPQFDDVFDEGGGWIQDNRTANLVVTVKQNVDTDLFITDLRGKFGRLPNNAICTVTNLNIAGDDSKLKLVLSGADRTILNNAAQLIRSKLQLVPGLSVEGINDNEASYRLSFQRDQLAKNGVKVDDALKTIELYSSQGFRNDVTINGQTLPVLLQTDKQSVPTSNLPATNPLGSILGGIKLKTTDGDPIDLNKVATLESSKGESVIRERNGQPFAVVSADITDRDVSKVTNQTENMLKTLSLPSGINYSFGGISEQVNQMIEEMSIALSVSALLVLLIVGIVFRGWKAPLSILVCIPLSVIGSVWGMFLFGKEWNLAALIGMMMLIGIVVTNGIVLVDKIERNLAVGMSRREAVLGATLSRIRPILMTACTTIMTLLPLVFFSRGDTVISQTLGIVVVGGMISSTFISLILIPTIYIGMHEKKSRLENTAQVIVK